MKTFWSCPGYGHCPMLQTRFDCNFKGAGLSVDGWGNLELEEGRCANLRNSRDLFQLSCVFSISTLLQPCTNFPVASSISRVEWRSEVWCCCCCCCCCCRDCCCCCCCCCCRYCCSCCIVLVPQLYISRSCSPFKHFALMEALDHKYAAIQIAISFVAGRRSLEPQAATTVSCLLLSKLLRSCWSLMTSQDETSLILPTFKLDAKKISKPESFSVGDQWHTNNAWFEGQAASKSCWWEHLRPCWSPGCLPVGFPPRSRCCIVLLSTAGTCGNEDAMHIKIIEKRFFVLSRGHKHSI